MNDTILAICQQIQDMGWATALRESQLMFPVIEGIHLLGLAFILGPVLMLDFRLAGIAWRDLPVSKVANTFVPYSVGGAVVMFVTGILLWTGLTAARFITHDAFEGRPSSLTVPSKRCEKPGASRHIFQTRSA